jgi:hypothetical protein
MTVYFANDGLIDLDVIRIMGVSAKVNENPIGFFGTGLKMAIAVLLRTGHNITLRRGSERFVFSVQKKTIRNKIFNQCYMQGEALPFTTELAKNWELWQAYRELHSNTIDEGGQISDKKLHGDTVFEIEGSGLQKEYIDRGSIFLQTKPLTKCEGLEIHPGRNRSIFYRGVRAGTVQEGTLHTYNILTEMELSEDRIFKSQWDVEYKLETMIPICEHPEAFIELFSETDTFDANLNFGFCANPSKSFLDSAKQFRSDANVNQSLLKIIEKADQRNGTFPPANATEKDIAKMLKCFPILKQMDCTLEPDEVILVETLGTNIFGIYHKVKDQIFLALPALDQGVEFATAVLFEEWCHKVHKFKDNSREFQSFLLHKLVAKAAGSSGLNKKDLMK